MVLQQIKYLIWFQKSDKIQILPLLLWHMLMALSKAGIMPSTRDRYSNASTASSSVTGTYSALPVSYNQACSGPIPG